MSNPTPQTPPPQAQRPRIVEPKTSLDDLAQHFVKDREDETIHPVLRSFAGRAHQLILHFQLLLKLRENDLGQINEGFNHIAAMLRPGVEAPLQPEAPQPGQPEAPPPAPAPAAAPGPAEPTRTP